MESFRQEYTMRHAEGRSPQEEIPEVIMVYPRLFVYFIRQDSPFVRSRGGLSRPPPMLSLPYVIYTNVR